MSLDRSPYSRREVNNENLDENATRISRHPYLDGGPPLLCRRHLRYTVATSRRHYRPASTARDDRYLWRLPVAPAHVGRQGLSVALHAHGAFRFNRMDRFFL